jgi:nicotinamide-nucleotide amidase
MAGGALKAVSADFGVAVTGIAGPGGGSKEKPVGLVHFASARRAGGAIHTHHERHYIKESGRTAIRLGAVRIALGLLIQEAKHF